MLPESVREWLKSAQLPDSSIETLQYGELAGKTILTGVSNNQINKDTAEFAEKNTFEDYLGVIELQNGELGSIAVPFDSREKAEDFEEYVREDGGRLRLTTSPKAGWFVYEAE